MGAAVQVAAAVLQRDPEDIASDDLREHRRAQRLAVTAIALLIVLAIMASVAALVARSNSVVARRNANQARQNADAATANEQRAVTFALTAQAEQWINTAPDDALGLAIVARERGSDRAMELIQRTLSGLPSGMRFTKTGPGVTSLDYSPSGARLAAQADGGLRVMDASSLAVIAELPSTFDQARFVDEDRLLLTNISDNSTSTGDTEAVIATVTGSTIELEPHPTRRCSAIDQ